MTFWSGNRIAQEINTVIIDTDDRSKKEGSIDCNAYTLHIGDEIYISPSDQTENPDSQTTHKIGRGEGFAIPPGQFAFLLTREIVHIPKSAMAFISIKAKIKLRGLVNVSGFHVDPNYRGKLIFSVYNAGPSSIHLQEGMPLFLIWFADLDVTESSSQEEDSADQYARSSSGFSGIDPQLVTNISGEILSLKGLSAKIKENERKISDRMATIEKAQEVIKVTIGILIGVAASILVSYGIKAFSESNSSAKMQSEKIAPIEFTQSITTSQSNDGVQLPALGQATVRHGQSTPPASPTKPSPKSTPPTSTAEKKTVCPQ